MEGGETSYLERNKDKITSDFLKHLYCSIIALQCCVIIKFFFSETIPAK